MSNKYPKLRKNNSCDNWLFTTLGDVTRAEFNLQMQQNSD